jgi:hypothetical protein
MNFHRSDFGRRIAIASTATANQPGDRIMAGQKFTDGIHLEQKQPTLRDQSIAAFEHTKESVGEWWKTLKIGKGHAKAMFKLGAHEITNALAALPDSNIRPMEEPGVVFNETKPHITEKEDYNAVLDRAAKTASYSDHSKGIGH